MQDSRTGDAEVDRMLERLDGLTVRPVVEHVQVVEQVHRENRGSPRAGQVNDLRRPSRRRRPRRARARPVTHARRARGARRPRPR